MKKKVLSVILTCMLAVGCITGCSLEDEADVEVKISQKKRTISTYIEKLRC